MVPVFWTISVMTTECLLISVVIKAIVSPRTAQYLVYFVILYIVYVILEQHYINRSTIKQNADQKWRNWSST